METKYPPLQKEWEERKRLRKEADKLWKEGDKLRAEGKKLKDKADELWEEAVHKHYGEDAKVVWRTWHEDNEPTCHVGSDVYV